MPSDETLRISLVSMLPLLRFSPSLVAVTPGALGSRLSVKSLALKKLAAPPPQFDAPQLLTQPGHPARVYLARQSHSESISRTSHPSPSIVTLSRRGDSLVRSQPLESMSERLHVQAAFPSSAAPATLACLPKKIRSYCSSAPTSRFSGDSGKVTFARHPLTSRSRFGCGPFLAIRRDTVPSLVSRLPCALSSRPSPIVIGLDSSKIPALP
jgi:hypothetical protein